MILCDTNILIEVYRNNQPVIDELKKIGKDDVAVSIITSCELVFGALNKAELQKINSDLSNLTVVDINESIGRSALRLMNRYSLSHHLSLPDAFIAATALESESPLYTLNKKDFRFIPGIKFYT